MCCREHCDGPDRLPRQQIASNLLLCTGTGSKQVCGVESRVSSISSISSFKYFKSGVLVSYSLSKTHVFQTIKEDHLPSAQDLGCLIEA